MKFLSFNDTIHIYEKWFYLKKVNQTMYLGPKETKPIRKTQNKRFLKKVMFLVAVGVPRMNHTTSTYFDGNIGCFPLIEKVPSKRTTKKRNKSTMITKEIT